ncbi:LysR family transcriptional regulator [Aureimonas glaciei]|uniref:LysR family transcriptional regulator n=1 Tax=Aureimonas glaciei TaxID=1776957 RepID=A0A916XYP8_9HYPH|nr:LysR family transcriptional regulator [Aureimonas glaciei]GGD22174.1 LysR family transcriptional regulator [Aureimonas glaciei]
MRFTLRQLEYFVAAGETGSITQASERINISQPSVSTAISQLEQELDVQLFIRHHAQGLSLTSAGRTMLVEAKRLVQQAEALYGVASGTSEEIRGQLSIGSLTPLAPMVLPELALSFTAAYPGVVIRLHADNQEMLLNGLRRATIDIALTYDLQISGDIEFTPLVDLPVHALVGETHALAGRSAVTLQELAQQPMILLDLPLSSEYFLSLFMKDELQPTIAYRLLQPDMIRTMVANGFGYTLANVTPRSDTALDGRRVVRLRLSGEHRPMTMGLTTLKSLRRTRLFDAFAAHARAFISDAYIPGMVAPNMALKRRPAQSMPDLAG